MPLIQWNKGPEHGAAIKAALPEQPFTQTIFQPELDKLMHDTLVKWLKAEIEVFKKFPKPEARWDIETFDTRNNKECFMGQGFNMNGQGMFEAWYSADLQLYRKSVGTINHKTWGNCTLLEIWGGDHMKDYGDMVKDVMLYCSGKKRFLPELGFYINPLFSNDQSGKWMILPEDIEVAKERQESLLSSCQSLLKQGVDPMYVIKVGLGMNPPKEEKFKNIDEEDEDDE